MHTFICDKIPLDLRPQSQWSRGLLVTSWSGKKCVISQEKNVYSPSGWQVVAAVFESDC